MPAIFRKRCSGPILHVVRWRSDRLDELLDDIAGNGTGLTLGVHSRIDATADKIIARLSNGNVYVNRSMIGAVVGTQPFGGTGLSGTGPKAGGPNYLRALRDRADGDDQHRRGRRQRDIAQRKRMTDLVAGVPANPKFARWPLHQCANFGFGDTRCDKTRMRESAQHVREDEHSFGYITKTSFAAT